MKKILYLILILFAVEAKSQKSVVFKMKYIPDHDYSGTVGMDMKCNITLSGDSDVIKKLKTQGVTQPIALSFKMTMNGDTKTGSTNKEGIFPLAMKYNIGEMNVNIAGKAIPMPAKVKSDITIYGHVGADGKLKADSLGGGKLKDTSQKKISQMINTFQNIVKFPDHPLKAGDTFTQDMPINIPLAGDSMAANSKVVYKLVSIANANAYFDVQQSMDMTIPIKDDSISLAGTGSGKMVYNIKDSFATDYQSNFDLKFNGKIKTLVITGTASMNMEYKYVIN